MRLSCLLHCNKLSCTGTSADLLLEVFFKGGWSSGVQVVVCATTAFPPPTLGQQPRRAGEASVKEALYQPDAHEHIQSLRYELPHGLPDGGVHLGYQCHGSDADQ